MSVTKLPVGFNRVAARRAAKAAAVAKPAAKALTAAEKKPLKIRDDVLLHARGMSHRLNRKTPRTIENGNPFQPYVPPPSVLPPNVKPMALDEALGSTAFAGLMQWGGADGQLFEEGIGFLGYAYLAQLTQRPEYRRISERIATEMTRKWIKLNVVSKTSSETGEPDAQLDQEQVGSDPLDDTDAGEGPEVAAATAAEKAQADRDRVRDSVAKVESAKKAKRIKELEDTMRRFKVKDAFYNIAEGDGWFGRYHLFVDVKPRGTGRFVKHDGNEARDELKTSIGNGSNATSRAKVSRGSIKAFRTVEPMWCYPAAYEAANPLKEGFYNPDRWYANGIEIHRSRLMCFVGREVPDILKPAYAFGGLSMSQMAKPYVDNWLRTRQAVADLIESFSVSGVYTNMQGTLQDGGVEALKRIELFNVMRSNAGAFALDKDSEEFFNVSTPLGTLDALQAQSQEQMSSVSGIPLIILLGITPTGLNASSEGEIRAFYDWIHAYQESFFRDGLQAVIHFIMLHLWGEIDEEITFEFEPLWSMTDKEQAEIQKIEAETDQIRIDSGVLDPGEVRKALAAQPESRYADINPEDVPEPPEQPGMGAGDDEGGDGGDGGSRSPGGGGGKGPADKAFDGASDEWNEDEHPRADDGKFGSGGGGTTPKSSKNGKESSTSSSDKPATSKYKTAGKPNWNGGTLSDPAVMETATLESNAKALRHAIKNSPFTHEQRAKREERLADIDAELKERSGKASAAGGKLDVSKLKKQGGKLGSNEGGVYTDDAGGKFYVKKPASQAHVTNEKTAAKLYQLAGVNTLDYREAGPDHVVTAWQDLDKNNIAKFTPAEKKAAAADFAVHAWLSNWDAAGLGGDNQGIMGGKPTTLDVGGSLRYRAQGGEKGKAFGDQVTELDTLRDKNMNPDAAGLFGKMTDAEIKSSIERVTSIPDAQIRSTVSDDQALADRLIARKKNMAQRFGIAQDEDPDEAMMAAALEASGGEEDDEDDINFDGDVIEIADDCFAMDEEQFDESKHKRDQDGKFSSTGAGGSSGEKPSKDPFDLTDQIAAGLKKKKDAEAPNFKSKKEHIAHLLTNGTTPKELMQTMGWPSVSMPAQAKSLGMKLEKKDGKYFGTKMTDAELKAAKESDQDKATQKAMAKHPVPETMPGSSAGQVKPPKAADIPFTDGSKPSDIPAGPPVGSPPADYSQFLGAVAEAAQIKDVHAIAGLFKFNPEWAKTFLSNATPSGKAALEKIVPGVFDAYQAKPAPKATEAELKKAVKSTTLPINTTAPAGVLLIKDFNDKYAGKDNLTAEQLNQKVQDYKDLQAALPKVTAEYEAQSKAEKAEAEKKAKAEAKKKTEAELAKKKAELEEQFAADPSLKLHYEAAEALFGGKDAGEKYAQQVAGKVKAAGLSKYMSPADAIPIVAYSGSHYGEINRQLRAGKMTEAQDKFRQSLNAGLDKLPSHDGTTYRKASLSPAQAALYEPGYIVEERGFMSTSKVKGTWSGSHNFTIHGKNGKDIQKLSSHASEAEVLFKSGSRFKVLSNQDQHIVLQEV